MIRLLFIASLLCLPFFIFPQDFEFKKTSSPSIFIPSGLVQDSEQKEVTLNKIKSIETALSKTADLGDLYWLHSHLAGLYSITGNTDLIIYHAEKGNRYNRDKYCKEYISAHVSNEEGDYPFQPHYLDNIKDPALAPIKKYCIENYKKRELYKRKKRAEKKEMEKSNSKFNKEYFAALLKISEADQKERKSQSDINWSEQNRLDSLNRIKLDSLFSLYGFPHEELVSSEGTQNAFMVMHHSTDCEWNKKWTPRFLTHLQGSTFDQIFSFFFYRNFNEADGSCNSDPDLLENLKVSSDSTYVKKMLDFTYWDQQFKK